MGFLAHGRKIDETPERVRYTFEQHPGDPAGGELVIPTRDPEDGWSVHGSDPGHRPKAAVAVVVKAVRAFRSTGSWPDQVHYAA